MDAVVELARVPRRPPRVDLAIAAALAVWALLEALLAAGPGGPISRVLTGLAFTVPLVLRRRWPVPVLLLIVAVVAARGALSDVPEAGSMPYPALLVATFSAALYGRPAWLAVLALPLPLVAIGIALATGYFSGSPGPADIAIFSFISLGAWAGGWLVRRRARHAELARAAAPELAREAVAAERARMARELHDIVAHSLSIIAVQAGAAEELLDEGHAVRDHLETVRKTARGALVELRRLVGVLREDEPVYAPQPGLARIEDLVAEARRAGLPVELSEEGARPAVSPGVELAAYRILQESLTNVRRHAGTAPTQIVVRYGRGHLHLEVANAPGVPDPAAGRGSGHGLIGMRERARLYGGSLDAGRAPDGGFRVRARLPVEEGAT